MEVTIATASLVFVSGAVVVAVILIVLEKRQCFSAPALGEILGPRETISERGALIDTLLIGHVVTAQGVGRKLSARVVFSEAASVLILSNTIAKKRSNLLRDCVASELDSLLAHVGVSGVECPDSSAIVVCHVDLRSWH